MGKKIHKLSNLFKRTWRIAAASFVLSLCIVTALFWLYYRQYNFMQYYTASVERSYKAIAMAGEAGAVLKEYAAEQHHYLATGDSLFLLPGQQLVQRVTGLLDSLRWYTLGHPLQQQRVQQLQKLAKKQLQFFTFPPPGKLLPHPPAAVPERTPLMDSIGRLVAAITGAETLVLQQQHQAKARYQVSTPRSLRTGLAVSVAILLGSFLYIVLEMRRRMRYQVAMAGSSDELRVNANELEQMTKVISHDLQEPLRKIRTFSNRLVLKHREQLDTDAMLMLGRMEEAALRMQGLVDELIHYSNISPQAEPLVLGSPGDIWKRVLQTMQEQISACGAVIRMQPLQQVWMYEQQVQVAFTALLDNAMKFKKAGTVPAVTISGYRASTKTGLLKGKRYYVIQVKDQGIGFNNLFREKIFQIFQRLHTSEEVFEGKGIGLAIVQKVMNNHHGYVTAEAYERQGSSFLLYFPL